ncbi:hypothetical protein IV203_017109 [Nitzschia inconspicua]|uniref:Uncharacterized protein n=1 Tax=Nitzschia inconspicua TaxID=303405 RepID=A0A9K3PKN8_9STRA|nr:hypothetical protein IV203_017109 [Nitzschia inconspicua]
MLVNYSKSNLTSTSTQLGVLGVAAVGVLSNCILLSSCDLLRYEEGSVGLRSYANEETGECTIFFKIEDASLKTAQSASFIALVVGIGFLAMTSIHNFVKPIPAKDVVLCACMMFLELCLLEVYTAQNNGICEVERCSWGTATIWLASTQLAFAAASLWSWYSSKVIATNKNHS